MTFGQGVILIVSHLLQYGRESMFAVSFKGLPHSVASYDKQWVLRTYCNLSPWGSQRFIWLHCYCMMLWAMDCDKGPHTPCSCSSYSSRNKEYFNHGLSKRMIYFSRLCSPILIHSYTFNNPGNKNPLYSMLNMILTRARMAVSNGHSEYGHKLILLCWCSYVHVLHFNPWVKASSGGLKVLEGLYSLVVKYFGTCFKIRIGIELSRKKWIL
jgi:hypothetical protein